VRYLLCLSVLMAPVSARAQTPRQCQFEVGSPVPNTLNPRLLAGSYEIEWHPTKRARSRPVRRERLELWRTAESDSSAQYGGAKAAPGDTLRYPLYGTIVPTGANAPTRDSLLRSTDPLSPPALLFVGWPGDTTGKTWPVLVLFVGTVMNRRPGVLAGDGSGVGIHLARLGLEGFAGNYGPAGLALTDAGFLCARRIP
jgi:hypothetical protein